MSVIGKIIDLAFGVAERVVRMIDDRKARKRAEVRKGLSHKDVEHQQAQIKSATRPKSK